MKNIEILLWQRMPYAPDEEPGMPRYRVAGTVASTAGNRAFIADVSVEIDGRDAECERVAGFDISGPDLWERLMPAMAECESLNAEMAAEAMRYYAGAR